MVVQTKQRDTMESMDMGDHDKFEDGCSSWKTKKSTKIFPVVKELLVDLCPIRSPLF
jgi:hypothetical protein